MNTGISSPAAVFILSRITSDLLKQLARPVLEFAGTVARGVDLDRGHRLEAAIRPHVLDIYGHVLGID